MEAANIIELRRHVRLAPDDVFALVGDEIVQVVNMSAAGICMDRPRADFAGKQVEFWVVPRSNGFLDMNRAVQVLGHVVGRSETQVRVVFSSVNYELANLIRRYQACKDA